MRIILFPILLLTTLNISAQNFERVINKIPFYNNQNQLQNTFSGGVSGAEFQFVDIDADEDFDLFYLNSDGSFEFMENKGTKFNPLFFISKNQIEGVNVKSWFYFVDIDADEELDLFTGGEANTITYLKNIGSKFNPEFIVEEDTLKDNLGNVFFSDNVSNPAFGDIDADGDYDFFLGNQNGSVTFYENIGGATNFSFKFITSTWQNISIIGGGKNLHGASSIEIKDIDNDSDLDVLWGDFFSRSLYLLENIGTSVSPNIKLAFDVYPQNEDSVFTRGFNMPRLIDIDADGDNDLFVSVLFDPTVPQTLMYYENEGSSTTPDFRKRSDDYFFTLDVGSKSIPVFADIDNDNDLDLFISSERFLTSSIFYYENTGSNNSNEFTFRDSSFFNITDALSISPTFGDLDGDGDLDLLTGNFLGKIDLYTNVGTAETPDFIGAGRLKDNEDNEIKFNTFAHPQLVDVDFDNDLDLVLGSFNGQVLYYINEGNAENYSFVEQPDYFSGIDVGDLSHPNLIDFDADGDLDLLIGNRAGSIFYYSNEGTALQPIFNLVSSEFIKFNFRSETAPVLIDIDEDTDIDLFVGNLKGGLYFFENQLATDIKETSSSSEGNIFDIDAYPNPFNSSIKINVSSLKEEKFSLKIFNVLGKEITGLFNGTLSPGNYEFYWNGKTNAGIRSASGVYFITLTNKSIVKSKRVLLIK